MGLFAITLVDVVQYYVIKRKPTYTFKQQPLKAGTLYIL